MRIRQRQIFGMPRRFGVVSTAGLTILAALAIVIVSALTAGCASVESDLLERDFSNTEWEQERLHGYPITLKVPTHLKLTVYDKYYLEPDPASRGWKIIAVEDVPIRGRTFSSHLIETEKIFTVDHKRPAAGSMQYGVNFSSDQYIADFKSRSREDTIRQASLALERAITQVGGGELTARTAEQNTLRLSGDLGLTTAPNAQVRPPRTEDFDGDADVFGKDEKVLVPHSVVCSQIFEIDDPNLELKIASFLENAFCPAQTAAVHYGP